MDFATSPSQSPLQPYGITTLAETLIAYSSLHHSLTQAPTSIIPPPTYYIIQYFGHKLCNCHFIRLLCIVYLNN